MSKYNNFLANFAITNLVLVLKMIIIFMKLDQRWFKQFGGENVKREMFLFVFISQEDFHGQKH